MVSNTKGVGMTLTLEGRMLRRARERRRDHAFADATAAWTLVMKALLVYVAPLTFEMLPD